MRFTCAGIIFALTALTLIFLTEQIFAQIPERVIFQPGSYAGGAYGYAADKGMAVKAVSAAAVQSEWETVFGNQQAAEKPATPEEIPAGVACSNRAVVKPMPYLAYHKSPLTGQIHIIPYQKGYPNPEEFPQKESHLKFALSALPCMTQDQPQIKYLDYYSPMPEIIEDKPSRLQLLLGYPNPAWTSCCDNRWGIRQAQCIGIEQFACGPYAEQNIRNQSYDLVPPQSHFGPLQSNAGGFRGNLFFNRPYSGAYPQAGYPEGYSEGYRQRLFPRLGAYQPAVGERYETSGYNHNWCSSCGKNHHSSQCGNSQCGTCQSNKGIECPLHKKTECKTVCKCAKCSAEKGCKTEENESDKLTCNTKADVKSDVKTAEKKTAAKGQNVEKQTKTAAEIKSEKKNEKKPAAPPAAKPSC